MSDPRRRQMIDGGIVAQLPVLVIPQTLDLSGDREGTATDQRRIRSS